MKILLTCILALALSLVLTAACNKAQDLSKNSPAPPAANNSVVIKVMTYNIHIGNPPSKPSTYRDLPAVASVINTEQPDLVSLNEVDVNTKRSGVTLDEAKELAALTHMYYFYSKAIDYDGGQFGDAILSRFPILETHRYELPVTEKLKGETRSVATITIKKGEHRFQFATTHLDHLGAEDNRILQAQKMKDVMQGISDPVILCGDFNAHPDSQTIAIIKGYMTFGCNNGCPLTFPNTAPNAIIDYITYKPLNAFSIKNYRTVNETYASDHLPVTAELELKF